jgi:sulfate transport system ATP-binding protein
MSIEVRNIVKRFGSFSALDDVSLTFPAGQLVALLGPSGCGKTTLLRVIAGLETPDSGAVLFHGEDASDRNVGQRQVGFVFQHYALFRHMTVFENVAFGLRVKRRTQRPSPEHIRRKVLELLQLVQVDWLADRYPHQLSGGQRQRIALARALAVEPKVHDELHITSIFVTHDQEEALEVADQVVLMNKGKVEQVGSPDAVYERPASPFVYGFLGTVNVFHGRAHDGRLDLGPVSVESPEHRDVRDAPAVVYARPHEIDIERFSPGLNGISVQLNRLLVVGPTARLELKREDTGEIVEAEIPAPRARALNLKVGEMLAIFPRNMQVFVDRAGEASAREAATPQRRVVPAGLPSLPPGGTLNS